MNEPTFAESTFYTIILVTFLGAITFFWIDSFFNYYNRQSYIYNNMGIEEYCYANYEERLIKDIPVKCIKYFQ